MFSSNALKGALLFAGTCGIPAAAYYLYSTARTKPYVNRNYYTIQNPETKQTSLFYYKVPLERRAALKELVAGRLAKELFGERSPLVMSYNESSNKSNRSDSERKGNCIGILSECIGYTASFTDLNKWMMGINKFSLYKKQQPQHLGESLAFSLLMGDCDIHLANFIMILNDEGRCYGIDHGGKFHLRPIFITDGGFKYQVQHDA